MIQNEVFKLQGKCVMITGASSGLGAHFATLAAKAGAHDLDGAFLLLA